MLYDFAFKCRLFFFLWGKASLLAVELSDCFISLKVIISPFILLSDFLFYASLKERVLKVSVYLHFSLAYAIKS